MTVDRRTVSQKRELRRYTDIMSAIDMLQRKRLVLVSPDKWDDQNDSAFLKAYSSRLGIERVLALCMADCQETYHHWRIFSGSHSGACIVFKRAHFLNYMKSLGSPIRCEKVVYKTNKQLRLLAPLPTDALPFYKRSAFKAEVEYRIIYHSVFPDQTTQDIPIDLSLIDRIVFSPWTPRSVCEATEEALRSLEGCNNVRFTRSALINNETWQSNLDDPDPEKIKLADLL